MFVIFFCVLYGDKIMEDYMVKFDIYICIIKKIIVDFEVGIWFWYKFWSVDYFVGCVILFLCYNGIVYCGFNIILFWVVFVVYGYLVFIWMIYCQVFEFGGQVCKGFKSQFVIYVDKMCKIEIDDVGEDCEVEIFFMKGYMVFNVDQIEGLFEQYYVEVEQMFEIVECDVFVEVFFVVIEVDICYGGN